ncbi:hypothetical protein HN011_007411 [Eciton burchellii]|nr:hypothetical protein HN011_007411 [Eciton burchellii]
MDGCSNDTHKSDPWITRRHPQSRDRFSVRHEAEMRKSRELFRFRDSARVLRMCIAGWEEREGTQRHLATANARALPARTTYISSRLYEADPAAGSRGSHGSLAYGNAEDFENLEQAEQALTQARTGSVLLDIAGLIARIDIPVPTD